jgi:hypothetical protein
MVTGMPKHFVRKTFDRWLAHSAARFHYPPRLVLQRKRYIELQFAGITPAIQCAISTEGMVGIYATYQGELVGFVGGVRCGATADVHRAILLWPVHLPGHVCLPRSVVGHS